MQNSPVRDSNKRDTRAALVPDSVLEMVRQVVPDVTQLLPDDVPFQQFRAALWLELTGTPRLATCSALSLRQSIIKAAQAGLLPGRDCHFIPYGQDAVYVPNYQGLLRALYRTNRVHVAFAEVVYTADDFTLDYGRPEPLQHVIARKHRGSPEGAYGYISMKDSPRPLVHYMAPDDLDRVRRHSRGAEQGAWVSDPDEMRRKSAMKNCMKYAPLPPAAQALLAADDEAQALAPVPTERAKEHIVTLFGPAPDHDPGACPERAQEESPCTT